MARVALVALLLSALVGGAAVAADEPSRIDINLPLRPSSESLPGAVPQRTRRSSRTAGRAVQSTDELVEVKGIGESSTRS